MVSDEKHINNRLSKPKIQFNNSLNQQVKDITIKYKHFNLFRSKNVLQLVFLV